MNSLLRTALFLSAAVSLTALTASQSHAAFITNGSFEFGTFDNSDLDGRPEIMLLLPGQTALSGWTVNGSGGVHWMDIGVLSTTGPVSHGSRSIDLQGLEPSPNQTGPSSLSQQFATTIDQWYRLTFDAYSGLLTRDNVATVSVGSLINQSFSGGPGLAVPSSFETLRFDFKATTTLSTLTFQIVNSNGYGPVIDNVRVDAVPEPSSIALLGSSLMAGFAARRRSRRIPKT